MTRHPPRRLRGHRKELNMENRSDKAVKAFCAVRDTINQREHPTAYRKAFKMPFKFYLEHTTKEAIEILVGMEN